MIALDLGESELLGFIKSLQTDVIILVEWLIFKFHNISFFVKSLEPSCLLWIDHGIFREHTEETGIDSTEGALSEFGI